jgi:heme exporter protein C
MSPPATPVKDLTDELDLPRGTTLLALHFAVGWALVAVTLWLAMYYVPLSEKALGPSYLIFFFHFPSAITCLLFFGFAGVLSAIQLATGSEEADRGALAAVEVGVLGCTITMVTGSVWAKAAWGKFWVWQDPRLMTVAIMWFTYLGYLALRAAIESPAQRARFCAVFGIIGAINIPLVWFSIRLFGQQSHPMNVELQRSMRETMWFGALSFLVLYTAFWRVRTRVARLKDEGARLEETLLEKG